MAVRPVTVQIDKLVLKGVRHADRLAVARGLQEQLTEIFSQPGMAEQLRHMGQVPRLSLGQVQMAANTKPQQIGVTAAKAIGKGLPR